MSKVKKIFPLYVLNFFGYLGYSLFLTIFTPLFLNLDNGMLPHSAPDSLKILTLGFILFLYPFGQFLCSPILGALSDRFGRRPLLLTSLLISSLAYSLIGISVATKNLNLLSVSLLIAGISEGNITLAQSVIADVSESKERSQLFGYIYAATAFSYLVGPILGGQLANPKFFSYQTPFFVTSGLLFSLLIWIYFSYKETHPRQMRETISYFDALLNIKNLFSMKTMRPLFLINFLIYLTVFGFYQTFPIFVVLKFQLPVDKLALLIAWTSISYVIINLWLIKPLTKYFSPIAITIVSSGLSGILLQFFLFEPSMKMIVVLLFFLGVSTACILPMSSVLVSLFSTNRQQGRALGINQSLQFFAEAATGLFIGFLGALYIKLAFIFFGITAILGTALLVIKRKKAK